jgi:hypothetical protein
MKKIILLFFLLLNLVVNAQEDKTVTLTVSGTGKTIEEAKTNALRSAIEQAFGAFISSKTEILNDNLIKDEIVSVANGNIHKFDIISQAEIPNNSFAITLNATVSISKLTSFAQSKGISITINGGLFAANIIQQELNEKSELISVKNILNTSNELLKKSFDYSIETRGNPTSNNGKYDIPLKITVKLNNNFNVFKEYLINSLSGLSMTESEITNYQELKKPISQLIIRKDTISQEDFFFKNDFNENEEVIYYYLNNYKLYKITTKEEVTNFFGDKYFIDRNLAVYRINKNDSGYGKIFFRNKLTLSNINDFLNNINQMLLNFTISNNLNKISGNIFKEKIKNQFAVKLGPNPYELIINPIEDSFIAEMTIKEKKRFPNLLSILPIKKTDFLIISSFSSYKNEEKITSIDFIDTKSLEEFKQLTEYKIIPNK